MAKKPAAKVAPPKSTSAVKPSAARAASRAEIYSTLAEKSGLTKKEVASVFSAMTELISKDLGKKGAGQFVVPGLLKLKVVHRPATKAKAGINPFTKEPMTVKAKPARNVVKALPLKGLKDFV